MPYHNFRKSTYKKTDVFSIETHPFETYLPSKLSTLIIGTFPTHSNNLQYNFFYSGKNNLFWQTIEKVFNLRFLHSTGDEAKNERRSFLESESIGITDMIQMCYRKNNSSVDENLYPIIFTDILSIFSTYESIKRLVFTSRTPIFGALGLFKTYLLQNGYNLTELTKRKDKILQGEFNFNNKSFEIMVPYSPSPRLIKEGVTTKEELLYMYTTSLR